MRLISSKDTVTVVKLRGETYVYDENNSAHRLKTKNYY